MNIVKKAIGFVSGESARIFTVLAATYLCLANGYYQGIYTGYQIASVKLGAECYPRIGGLCFTDLDPYSMLANIHVYISWLLIILISASVIKKESLSLVISVPSSIIVFLLLGYTYFFKVSYSHDEAEYLNLMRETMSADLVRVALSFFLLLIQLFLVFEAYRKSTRIRSELPTE